MEHVLVNDAHALGASDPNGVGLLLIATVIVGAIGVALLIWRAVHWHRLTKADPPVNAPDADDIDANDIEFWRWLNNKPATERGARRKLGITGIALPGTLPAVRQFDPDFVSSRELLAAGARQREIAEAHVVEETVHGWDGFDPFEVLDQLRRATDGDVSQRLLKWSSLGPLLADPSREVAPEFARLVSRVGTGALAIVDGEPEPVWDSCMTGAHRIVTCPALTRPTPPAGVLWDIPRDVETDDPALFVRGAVRYGEVTS